MSRLRFLDLATGAAGSTVDAALSGSHNNSTTTLTLNAALTYANGTAVPTIAAPDYVVLVILDANGHVAEVVKGTAYTTGGTSITVTRAQEGTAAVSHASGAKVRNAPTPEDFDNIEARLDLIENPWDKARMLGYDGLHPNDLGMTFLAATYAATLAAAGKTPATSTPVWAYGDSWTAADTENTAGMRAIVQLVSNLGLGTLTNKGVGGYKAADIAGHAIGSVGTFPAATSALVVVGGAGLNDLQLTDSAQQRRATKNALRALLAVLSAAERIEQSALTFSGTWASTTNADTRFSGGTNAITSTEGAAATYTIATAGTYYLLTQGVDGATPVGGKLTITQGATTLGVLDLNAQTVNTSTGGIWNDGVGPVSIRLENVVTGTLTITYSKNGRSGTVYGFVDALVRVSATPPTILAVKPVEVLASTHVKPGMLAYIRDTYDALATEFGSHVVVCDPESA